MKKSQLTYALIFILLTLPYISPAEEDTWTRKADMPTPRGGPASSVVNGKIYVIGGGREGPFSTVEEYDPATDTWTRKADMPTPRAHLSTSVVNGRIYAIGGSDGAYLSTVEEYDPAADMWVKKADMPTPRAYLSTSVVNGRIYAIGGSRVSHAGLPTVEEYDPSTDTWMKRTDMPTEVEGVATSAVDGKIYAIGGGGWLDRAHFMVLSSVQEYDPMTDTWAKKANMPTARGYLSTSVVNGKIYAIGGALQDMASTSTVEVYDLATDTWTKRANMPTVRFCLSTSVVNGYIYAIGGGGNLGGPYTFPMVGLSIVEEYDTGVGIRVRAVSPQEGSVAGSEPITIFGKEFPPGASVTIGGKPLTELKVTDTLITGVTPPGAEGEWDVLITAPSIDFTVFAGKFIYNPLSNVVVTSITPTNGKQVGGNVGSITGSGFLLGATVTIGGIPATNVGVTPTLITFTIPSGTEGAKDVVVTNPDGQKDMLRGGYTHNPLPVIEEVRPLYGGPLRGGTEIIITGNHFMEGIVVTIGEERVGQLGFFSPTELRLKTPPGTVGSKIVRVVNPDGQEAILEGGFTYNPAPTISSVMPNAGPLEGGTPIVISGTGFLPGLVGADVLIGGAEASFTVVASPTKITAETPPSTPGVKDVVVVNRDGQKATLKAGFTYNPAPVIAKVIPDNGRLAGGTSITIQGSGFLPGARVLIRTGEGAFRAASSIQVVSLAIITAVTPPGEPGPKDVAILNPDGQIISLPEGFTYNPMPTITRITPDHGTSSGGTKLTIEGTGFLQGARVMIGERVGTTMVKDDETIEAVTPPNPPGILDVHVINPDTQKAVMREAFVSVGELVYNYPNPFRASEGTTFRYVTNQYVEVITVRIFNLRGVPIGIARGTDSNEVRWHNPSVHVGLYVYLLEARIEGGKVRRFKNMLEVRK
jgi:N-acetylneuraminic acid mutarotase